MKIVQALLDPKWQWGTMTIGHGPPIIFLKLHHPVHGEIDSLVPPDVARSMAAALLQLAGTVEK